MFFGEQVYNGASIEYDQSQFASPARPLTITVAVAKRLIQHIRIGLERRVGQDEVVGAIQLDAVPGIIDNGDVRIRGYLPKSPAAPSAQLADGQGFGLE